jgi:hypothetical protein
MTKFYRVSFFNAIGGFVRELMSDGIPSLVSLTTRTLRSVSFFVDIMACTLGRQGSRSGRIYREGRLLSPAIAIV